MIAPAHFNEDSLEEFSQVVADVLRQVAENRDLMTDKDGNPAIRLLDASLSPNTLRLDFEADLSGIGMPTNMPVTVVRTRSQPDHILWQFEGVKVATTPTEAAPKDAASILDMVVLLDGFRRWATRGTGRAR